jgi:hypothetical protein
MIKRLFGLLFQWLMLMSGPVSNQMGLKNCRETLAIKRRASKQGGPDIQSQSFELVIIIIVIASGKDRWESFRVYWLEIDCLLFLKVPYPSAKRGEENASTQKGKQPVQLQAPS